jgi:K+-sensing histidine kinase KdpD
VNHDLRTPLTTILGHTELLIEQQHELPPGAAASVDALWRAGRRLHEVVTWISQWIDLAYTSAGEGTGADLAEFLHRHHRD